MSSRCWTLNYTAGFLCLLKLFILISWFFPSRIRKFVTYFVFFRSPSLRDFGVLKRPLTFKVLKNLDYVLFYIMLLGERMKKDRLKVMFVGPAEVNDCPDHFN